MVQKDQRKPRGRPRAYDPQQAMQDATSAFWRHGYAGTSLDDIGDATGMNRPSLYAAFGDKRALYLAALQRYVESGRAAIAEGLAGDLPLARALGRVYDRALALYLPDDDDARGCFLISTATTEAMHDPEVRAVLGAGLRSFDRAFEARLRCARDEGELPAGADPAALARIASALLHTLALRSRAGDSRASLRATAATGIALLCGGGPPRRPRR